MTKKKEADFGTWPSVIAGEVLTQSGTRLQEPQWNNGHCYWLETRPEDEGRTVLVTMHPLLEEFENTVRDVSPKDVSIRTRINEYGGGCYAIHQEKVYYCNNADQRIYSINLPPIDLDSKVPDSSQAQVLTPEGAYRYGDLCLDAQRQRLICVCEISTAHPKNSGACTTESCIVAIKLDGSSKTAFEILAFGKDFYSNPTVSPDGHHLCWLSWNHPNMPWDHTECWVAEFDHSGQLSKQTRIAGHSEKESIFQPQWSPTGELYCISDRNLWWNLYRCDLHTKMLEPVIALDAEFATPQWLMGLSTYGFLNSFTLFCSYTQHGEWYAARFDTHTQTLQTLDLPYSTLEYVRCDDENDAAVFIGSSPTQASVLVQYRDGACLQLRQSAQLSINPAHIAIPQHIEYKNTHQQTVHAFFYPPTHAELQGKANTLPPLIVVCHGGPTGATRTAFNPKIQYWTNRGFAVLDVNYSGSTGYGRAYRDRLKGQWGILDVEDICSGAAFLTDSKQVDPEKLIVRGSSAGAYTVLCALTFHDVFKAGASLYGISDLQALVQSSHAFESRYMDSLIGPYPEQRLVYHQRSPLLHAKQLQCPVIFLQGLEDRVVPPQQAEKMVEALVQNNIPVAYVTYPNEGHGFRQAETLRHSFDVEYAFYTHQLELSVQEDLTEVPYVNQNKDNL